MTTNIIIKQVKYSSESYKQALDFRFKILREPLGLGWSKEEVTVKAISMTKTITNRI